MTDATLGTFFTTLAYIVGATIFWLDVRGRKMATHGIGLVALWGACGGVLGAKATEWLLSHSEVLRAQPLLFFDPQNGGRTIIGGVVVGWICVEIAKCKLGIRRSTGDSFALALAAGEFIGRIGCFFHGCCYGSVCTTCKFGAIYQHGAMRYPTQLMLSLAALTTFAVLLWLRRKCELPEGALWKLYLLMFGVSRFAIEFARERHEIVGMLSLAQIVCLILALSSTRLLWNSRTDLPNAVN